MAVQGSRQKDTRQSAAPTRSTHVTATHDGVLRQQNNVAAVIQRAQSLSPAKLSAVDLLTLQRTVGNRAVGQLLRASAPQKHTVQPAQCESAPDVERHQHATPTENRTGLPDKLKSGIESLSGYDMSDVQVHFNSSKPAQLQAHAYTQGTNIHVAPGQEKYLPHEAWHVVQQKQVRVKPTLEMKGAQINDDGGLEREADVMGGRAVHQCGRTHGSVSDPVSAEYPLGQNIQRVSDEGIADEITSKALADATRQRMDVIKSKQLTLTQKAWVLETVKAVNDKLNDKATKCPPVKVNKVDKGDTLGASFLGAFWEMEITVPAPFNRVTTLNDQQVAEIIDSVHHECVHAEQWWRLIRRRVTLGQTSQEIKNATHAPDEVIAKAFDPDIKQAIMSEKHADATVRMDHIRIELREFWEGLLRMRPLATAVWTKRGAERATKWEEYKKATTEMRTKVKPITDKQCGDAVFMNMPIADGKGYASLMNELTGLEDALRFLLDQGTLVDGTNVSEAEREALISRDAKNLYDFLWMIYRNVEFEVTAWEAGNKTQEAYLTVSNTLTS